MTGVPRPLFLGIAAALASLVPAVGTLLVWVPAGLYLLAIGSPGAAIVEFQLGPGADLVTDMRHLGRFHHADRGELDALVGVQPEAGVE